MAPFASVESETQSSTCIRVLIPTHGRATLLGRTLASLAECDIPEGYVETVVIENGSRAGAEDVVTGAAETHPHLRLRYMHVERANKSHALNEALKGIDSGLVVFFDDDVEVGEDVLEQYASAAGGLSEGAFFGGAVRAVLEVEPAPWVRDLLPASAGHGYNPTQRHEDGYYLGANWAAFAGDVRSAGGFDPNFGPGSPTGSTGQESQMQRRLLGWGCRMIDVPGAVVSHEVPAERCSLAWLVHRRMKEGVKEGRLSWDKGSRAVPGYAIPLGIRAGLAVVKRTLVRDPVGRWRARVHLAYSRGLLKGYFSRMLQEWRGRNYEQPKYGIADGRDG